LLRGQFLLWAEAYATFFGSLHPIHLSLGAYLRFKLADGAEHVEHQTPSRIAGVKVLIEHVEVDLFAIKFIGDLAQMQGGASQAV
jgi:hypothetical protein